MNNCADFIELISAYSDCELADSDMQRLEGHLSACENCSALLDLYRETTVAVTGSCVPAPESLRDAVMGKILVGGIPDAAAPSGALSEPRTDERPGAPVDKADTADSARKRRVMRIILTRYVPIAACLAIILLTVPRYINRSYQTDGSVNENGELSVRSSDAHDYAPGGTMNSGAETANDAVAAGGGSFGSWDADEADGGSVSPPAASASVTPGVAAGAADNYTAAQTPEQAPEPEFTDTSDDMLATEDTYDPMVEVVEPTEPNVSFNEPAADSDEPDGSPGAGSSETPAQPNDSAPAPVLPPPPSGGNFDGWPDMPEQSPGGSLFNDSLYAIIQINGGLSEFLTMYGLEPVDGMEEYYDTPITIPREYADMLIEFVRGLDGVTITVVDEDGGYAVVIYSPTE